MLVQYVDSNKVCINASNRSFFFLHNTCRPTKSSINHDYGGRKSNSIVEPTKNYLCTLQMFTGDLRGSHSSYILQDDFSKLETIKIGKTMTN